MNKKETVELILSLKRNIRCLTLKKLEYKEGLVVEMTFNCLHDIDELRHELYYFYKCPYIENNKDIEMLRIYSSFEYKTFRNTITILHFHYEEIHDEDDDLNDEENINKHIPDWVFEQR